MKVHKRSGMKLDYIRFVHLNKNESAFFIQKGLVEQKWMVGWTSHAAKTEQEFTS